MDTDLITTDEQSSISSLPESLQQRILAASNKLKESSVFQVSKIRNDVKSFIFPDGTEVADFSGVIVAAKHTNMHYAGAYEEGISNPPDCFAILEGGDDAACKDLTPHVDVVAKYAAACGICPKFQWGSDKDGKGKGKACSEYVLLAIAVPALGDDLFLLECKKSNAKAVDGYLATVTNKYGHPIAVTTAFNMGNKGKWAHSYIAQSPAPQALIASLAERIDEASLMLVERAKGAYNRNTSSAANDASTSTEQGAAEQVSAGRKARER